MKRNICPMALLLVFHVGCNALFAEGRSANFEKATFAAGCFWGTEEFFRKIPGVIETRAGYTGGMTPNPKYDEMHDGHTGHAESVEILFDPTKVTYQYLLDQFFKMHDPTTPNQQGNDVGSQYRSAIFYHSEKQKAEADAFMTKVNRSHAWPIPLITQLAPAKTFWKAEEYHQKYLMKHPGGYDNHYLRKITFDSPTAGDKGH
jgi:methionine-S-sulfoxide reductase